MWHIKKKVVNEPKPRSTFEVRNTILPNGDIVPMKRGSTEKLTKEEFFLMTGFKADGTSSRDASIEINKTMAVINDAWQKKSYNEYMGGTDMVDLDAPDDLDDIADEADRF